MMIEISQALEIIGRETHSLGSETEMLERTVGRILAQDIVADSDMPPFDRSQMDGYAVKANDTESSPVSLRIVGESAAGRGWHNDLRDNEAVRIMTGAPVPHGADSIQKLELARELVSDDGSSTVEILEATEEGRHIVRRGQEISKGDRLFESGERISAQMIASLAAFGYGKVQVAVRPKVAILSTGSEIVEIESAPGPDQIRNSNSVMLKALCEVSGAIAEILPIAGDDLGALKSRIAEAAGVEILIITGGVSVGKYDLTKEALRLLGATIFFEKAKLKPGKPTVFARRGRTLVFGLPGNPVSAAVAFYLFVRTSILKMQNAAVTGLKAGHAVLTDPAKAARARDTYLPARLRTDSDGRLLTSPIRWHGSSDFVGFAKADCLIVLPAGKTCETGEVADVLFI